ncbi:hypothetical protein A9Q82_08615 [Cycloclasticus sp. 46_120_T64]|nr:hypothetical protein A9Q82_08615 [Cycloclasticus sp. 46_120_T64]
MGNKLLDQQQINALKKINPVTTCRVTGFIRSISNAGMDFFNDAGDIWIFRFVAIQHKSKNHRIFNIQQLSECLFFMVWQIIVRRLDKISKQDIQLLHTAATPPKKF